MTLDEALAGLSIHLARVRYPSACDPRHVRDIRTSRCRRVHGFGTCDRGVSASDRGERVDPARRELLARSALNGLAAHLEGASERICGTGGQPAPGGSVRLHRFSTFVGFNAGVHET